MKKFGLIVFYNSLLFLFFYFVYIVGYKTVVFKLSDFLIYLLTYNFITLSYLSILGAFKNGEILKCFVPKQDFYQLINEYKNTENYLNSHIKKRKIFDSFCVLYEELDLNGLSNCMFGDYRLYLTDIENIEAKNNKKIDNFLQIFDVTVKNILKKYPKDEK